MYTYYTVIVTWDVNSPLVVSLCARGRRGPLRLLLPRDPPWSASVRAVHLAPTLVDRMRQLAAGHVRLPLLDENCRFWSGAGSAQHLFHSLKLAIILNWLGSGHIEICPRNWDSNVAQNQPHVELLVPRRLKTDKGLCCYSYFACRFSKTKYSLSPVLPDITKKSNSKSRKSKIALCETSKLNQMPIMLWTRKKYLFVTSVPPCTL